MKSMRENLEALLAKGQDGALLRFTLGELCLKAGEAQAAADHLARAVALDPDYSAAWKLYGRALAEAGRREEAAAAYARGIAVAEARGDRQAAKEMRVFLKRIDPGR
ncbi:MAG TPA: tetratricopeptide repeat protein [Nevskiales bacterium]|nr:tetratricopeptide repeat protein [Nevskiales bacterium]